ncbi:Glycoside hydrolase family 31 protein [Mycena sanguinolenta]|uniref:Glycoside hydrolase family 31 protein n=1 Tax=Mycena sanguinolenta TaxID=230812 RepID=A0A8H7CWN3_9AGAR|nr:Glycoside hydrolase family 31 protein [Mycena sanguinolenta]
MPLLSPAPLDEGWQVVSPEWWRIPFSAVSWAYSPQDVSPQDVAATKVTQSPGVAKVAKPPHYHAALFSIRAASADDQQHGEDLFSEGDDGGLNPDLVGFKGAEAALESYEIDVGFHWPPTQIEEKSHPDLALEVKEDHVALLKERWDEFVQDLTGGLSIANTDRYHDSDDDSMRGLHRSTSTLSSIDLTDSERSVLSVSMPATPRAPRSYANIVVKTTSPSRSSSSRDSDRSPRRLNAGASTFVPSPAKAKAVSDVAPFLTAPKAVSFPSLNAARPPSPSFNANFVFPSLDVPPLPAVKIAKDAQGFYSEVESTPTSASVHARTSSTLLPAFLHDAFTRRRPPASKTRAIIDRLKSSGSGGSPSPVKTPSAPPPLELSALSKPRLSVSECGSDGDSPALEGDSDGWIGGEDNVATTAAVNSKSRRTRDLFLALTRRRSSSSPPKPTLVAEPPSDEVVGITVELPSPSSSSSNDGWIEGPALLLPESAKTKPAVVPPPERKLTPAAEVKPQAPRQPSMRGKKNKRSGPVPVPVVPHPPPSAFYRPPPPYYYPQPHPHAHPPVPVPYAAAYMHQMQVLQAQQHQMHMRRGSAPAVPIPVRAPRGSMGSGEWYPYAMPVAAYPVPVPGLHPAPLFVPRGL